MTTDPAIKSILENYDVLKILGEEGKVFKVRNKKLDCIESLKLIRPNKDTKIGNIIARFQREIKTVNSIKEFFPNILIPKILSSQIHKEYLYYTMEYIEGNILKKYMFSTDPKRAVEIIIGVAKILEKIHSKNILHRDIKPSNIMVDNRSQIWLLDFGITKQIEGQSPELTKKGDFVGTPQYVSPEQVIVDELGPPSDIYSLGVILYEMLTHKPMTTGKNIRQLLESVLREPIPPIRLNRKISEKLNSICLKAVHKNKKLRYQNATELREDLESL